MGRRLALLALGLAAAGGAYFGLREGQPPPEPDLPPRHEQPVEPAGLSSPSATREQRLRHHAAAALAVAPGQGFPAAVPWAALHGLGGAGGLHESLVAALAAAPAHGFP